MTVVEEVRANQESLSIANEALYEAFREVDGTAHTALVTARHNVKLMTALRVSQLEHGQAIAGLATDMARLTSDVVELKSDVGGLTSDVAGLTSDVGGLRSDVAGLRSDVAEVLRRLPA